MFVPHFCIPHYLHLVMKFHCVYMLTIHVHILFVSDLRPLVTERFVKVCFGALCASAFC